MRAIVVAVACFALLGTAAQAEAGACVKQNRYCHAVHLRHTLRAVRHLEAVQAHRVHVRAPRHRAQPWSMVRLIRSVRWHRKHLTYLRKQPTYRDPRNVHGAICFYFGKYCAEAWAVTACESTHSIYDQLGQYLGLFQMGDYARGRYGGNYGSNADPWSQSKAAWGYFSDSGYDWSPWSCKPDGSVRYPG